MAITNVELQDATLGIDDKFLAGGNITGDTGNDGILGVGETWTVLVAGGAGWRSRVAVPFIQVRARPDRSVRKRSHADTNNRRKVKRLIENRRSFPLRNLTRI